MRFLKAVASVLALSRLTLALNWEATPFNPSSIPLAVRSPYLSAWLPQGNNGNGNSLNSDWPLFWTGQIMAWVGLAKVDGKTYSWLGQPTVNDEQPYTKATQKSVTITATQTIFVLSAGPVDLTISFLSPVEPDDLVKQSMPFSYYSVSAKSTDGAEHAVQLYTDISGEWVSGSSSWTIEWETQKGDILTHKLGTLAQAKYEEINDVILYGHAYLSTLNTAGTTYQTGPDYVVRGEFLQNGKLTNTEDTAFRQISNAWPVFAFSKDLTVGTTATEPVLFTIGHARDDAVQYVTDNNVIQKRHLLFFTKFATVEDALASFIADYASALDRANALDAKIHADASKISDDYAGIVALSVRQALAAIEITTSEGNPDDIIVFMKEISSNGNMNTVDVIFPAWPIFMYINPLIGKYLLEANFRYQATGMYPNDYAVHDMGSNFPKALGHNDGRSVLDEPMPVEESGNMIIMALDYARRTGDNEHITKHIDLLEQWTKYLIEFGLIPAHQLSTDDFAGQLANQTNLAIKAIVGIGAMAEIETILGNTEQAANYSAIATAYVPQWQKLATAKSGDHLTLSYGQEDSWGLSYNLFADRLLKLNLFPDSIYEMQTAWYATHANEYGVPLDTRHTYTKSDWEIYTSTWVTSTDVRDTLITSVKKWLTDGKYDRPFSDWYDTVSGTQSGFTARPVVGGHLIFLIM
ncbi:hypothetical protein MKEN_01471500 [Mycena kentingensis (nom. inval.)]|nr:hypothetical protein MKEN_01471500 [Mycena kentingensis (nom. inval.)]